MNDMTATLLTDMEHEMKIREALRAIAAAEPDLAARALDTMKRGGTTLQSRYNDIASDALKGKSLTGAERRRIVGLVRISEPESFDAMLRCRMSKEQLTTDLPARAKKAGFTDISKYVRWILFGEGEPETAPEREVITVDNWNNAIDAAADAARAIGGRPKLVTVVNAIESLKREG